jgi:hydroxyacylglutathione hydrolase
MQIQQLVMGHLATNCYIVKINQDVLIIDPVQDAPRIQSHLKAGDCVHAILLTHGHFDHIGAVDDLYALYRCPIYLHHADHSMVQSSDLNFSFKQNIRITSPLMDYPDKLTLGPFEIDILESPGHSEGCVLISIDEHLFTGDTLFKGDIGRTDLASSDPRKMRQSLKLFRQFDRDLKIYPGHEEATTLYSELQNNPYL